MPPRGEGIEDTLRGKFNVLRLISEFVKIGETPSRWILVDTLSLKSLPTLFILNIRSCLFVDNKRDGMKYRNEKYRNNCTSF